MPDSHPKIAPKTLHRQLEAIFSAWGFPAEQAKISADVLTEADLLGIDSHGITLIPLYDEFIRSGLVVTAPDIRVARDFGAVAVIDGGGGFGQAPSVRAMDLAVEKARAFGIGAVGVRNSNHFGAAGVYALRAAEQGLIGFSTTAVFKASIVPTHGREARFGTNPIAFAAPGRRNRPFLLDMATSTVALGKFKLYAREDKAIPPGWALDEAGRPQTDPKQALLDRLMTPLGGSRDMGGHKGYGLAAMVEILSTLVPGASYAPLRPSDAARNDVGHFHLAMHPEAFREAGAFEEDLDALLDALRATPPADPAQPVIVAGDPEYATKEQRSRDGIPVPRSLLAMVQEIAARNGAEFFLADAAL
jgi:LDH2 family malate/lactate/ureidoglycolate dehydrogenase